MDSLADAVGHVGQGRTDGTAVMSADRVGQSDRVAARLRAHVVGCMQPKNHR
jgi:hypothetical protein